MLFKEHAHRVTVACPSPCGEWVASGDARGVVKIWPARLQEGQLEPQAKAELQAMAGAVEDIAWSGDSQRIAVGGESRGACVKAFVWNTGSCVGECSGHSKRVLSVAFRAERPFKIASGGEDFYCNFYEGPPFKLKSGSNEHGNFVNALAYAPDGATFVSAGYKNILKWDGLTGERSGEIGGAVAHEGSIYGAAFSPDSSKLLTCAADKSAKLWDVKSGNCEATFAFAGDAAPALEHMQMGCAFAGETPVTLSLSGDLNCLDASKPGAPARVVRGHAKPVTALAAGSGGNEFFSASIDGSVLRWDVVKGCVGNAMRAHGNAVVGLASRGGALVSAAMDDTVRMTAAPDEGAEGESSATDGQPKTLSAATNASVSIVVTTSGVSLFDGSKQLSHLGSDAMGFEPTCAAISPDGSAVAIGSPGGKIYAYERTGDTLSPANEGKPLERHTADVTQLAYSPDGAILASGDAKREVVMWDAAKLELKQTRMVYHTARITAMAWSPDSTRLATGSLDMSVIVWKVGVLPTKRKTISRAHHGGVQAITWLDANRLVSGGADACLRVWKVDE